jgi:peptidoglycan/LPS O-acetylase OafA/YrhL
MWFAPRMPLLGAGVAVDFFFCLSGFVLAHAYIDRLTRGLSLRTFMLERLTRLYPLLAAGYVLGALYATLRLFGEKSAASELSAPMIAKSLILSLCLIPNEAPPIGYGLFPLDDPTWSLFFEIVVNLGFAASVTLLGWQISRKLFLCLIIMSGFTLLRYETVVQGFLLNTLNVGLARVCLSFFIGVFLQRVLSRRTWVLPIDGDKLFLILCAVMIVCFIMEAYYPFRAWELSCILLIFPSIVAIGATSQPTRLQAFCHVLGELSYPVYILHAPIVFASVSIGLRLAFFANSGNLARQAASVMCAICMSWLILVIYDRPLRSYLRCKNEQRHRDPRLRRGDPGANAASERQHALPRRPKSVSQ